VGHGTDVWNPEVDKRAPDPDLLPYTSIHWPPSASPRPRTVRLSRALRSSPPSRTSYALTPRWTRVIESRNLDDRVIRSLASADLTIITFTLPASIYAVTISVSPSRDSRGITCVNYLAYCPLRIKFSYRICTSMVITCSFRKYSCGSDLLRTVCTVIYSLA